MLPRLDVAGVDLDMVRVICTDDDGTGSPVFPDHMPLITDPDRVTPPSTLVVVDSWLDTVPTNLSVKDTHVRGWQISADDFVTPVGDSVSSTHDG